MKSKEYYAGHIISVLVVVLILFVLTLLFPYQFTIQYLDEDDNLVTEIFYTREGFNERAEELKADSIFYWPNHE